MASIDGLSSGLDTTTIINQLMQLERQPQLRLQSKQSAAESSVLSLRTLNSKFLTIKTATAAFGATVPPPPGTPVVPSTKPTDWQLTSASSSDATRVSVQAVTGAAAGTLEFNVAQLARAASYLGSTVHTGSSTPGAFDTSLVLTRTTPQGATPITIDTGDGSLAATVAAINRSGAGVAATTVQVKPGEYRLQLSSTTTGTGTVTLTGSAGVLPFDETVAGQDAVLVLAGGVEVTRSSNTISDVLDGVTLTLTKADTPTTPPAAGAIPTRFVEPKVAVTVSQDTDGVVAKVQALVDAANAARTEARSLTAFDPITKVKGRLYGDSGVRGLVDRVRAAISDGTDGPALAGVTVTREGTVELDKPTLLAALAKNPAAVETALGKDGLAGRLHVLADEVSRGEAALGGPGVLTNAIKSRERQIETFKTDIDSWDTRLALKEVSLQRTYTALETALGRAKSQGQWLASQLANLPTSGGS